MVGLHALQGVLEERAPFEVDLARFGEDAALSGAARPEGVAHGAPRVVRVGAVEGFAVAADLEAGGGAGDGYVDDAGLVGGGFDGVEGCVFGEGDGAVGGVEGEVGLVKAVVVEGVGGPEGGGLVVRVEDFGVEMAGCEDAAVYGPGVLG